jgi:hypothetical protein
VASGVQVGPGLLANFPHIVDMQIDESSDGRFFADARRRVEEVFFMPTLKGFGTVKDLHVSMSEDSDLLDLVSDFVASWSTERFGDKAALDAEIKEILFTWAGVEGVSPTSRGAYVDGQELAFLEKYFGKPYNGSPIGSGQGDHLANLFDYVVQNLGAHLIVQSGLADLYEAPPYYSYLTGETVGGVLSSTAIAALTPEASAAPNAENYWVAVAATLITIKDVQLFTAAEITALDSAIQTNVPTSSWAAILSQALISLTNTYLATEFSDHLIGGDQNDNISALGGDDVIVGSKGVDNLYGGVGNDTFVFTRGDGDDNVYEYLNQGSDTVRLEGYNLSDVRIWTNANGDLEITSKLNTSDIVQIMASDTGQGFNESRVGEYIEQLIFDDATVDLTSGLSLEGEDNSDGGPAYVYGTAFNDTLRTNIGSHTLYGNAGDDVYVYAAGGGTDYIYESLAKGADTVRFEGFDLADVRIWTNANGDLEITSKLNTNDIVRIMASETGQGFNESRVGEYIEQLIFDDTIVDLTSGLSLEGEDNSDGGPAYVYGTAFNDTLRTNLGSHAFYGNGGNDTFIYTAGGGNDHIYESLNSGTDAIRLWGYVAADVRLYTDSNGALLMLASQMQMTLCASTQQRPGRG